MSKVRLFLLVLGLVLETAGAQTSECSIPLKLRRGVPFVAVKVNGRGPFTFAVDTGTAPEAIVSPALVKALELPLAGRTWLVDLTGKRRQVVDQVLLAAVELPGQAPHPARAMVHEPSARLGPYDGVLGFAFFRDTILTLDFPRGCMRLNDVGLAPGSGPDVLPFTTPRNVPVVELTIGQQKLPAQVDSGGGGINLPSAARSLEFARHSEVLVRAQSQVARSFSAED